MTKSLAMRYRADRVERYLLCLMLLPYEIIKWGVPRGLGQRLILLGTGPIIFAWALLIGVPVLVLGLFPLWFLTWLFDWPTIWRMD
jgi:hypothetical protein